MYSTFTGPVIFLESKTLLTCWKRSLWIEVQWGNIRCRRYCQQVTHLLNYRMSQILPDFWAEEVVLLLLILVLLYFCNSALLEGKVAEKPQVLIDPVLHFPCQHQLAVKGLEPSLRGGYKGGIHFTQSSVSNSWKSKSELGSPWRWQRHMRTYREGLIQSLSDAYDGIRWITLWRCPFLPTKGAWSDELRLSCLVLRRPS